jgi:hypothetical protein
MILKPFLQPGDRPQHTTYQQDRKTVGESLIHLSEKHGIRDASKAKDADLLRMLRKFKSIEGYDEVYLVQGAEILGTQGQAFLVVLSINSTVTIVTGNKVVKQHYAEWEFVGLSTLAHDFGQVYIRPELIRDKINELFDPTEIDFDFDKAFSKKYFVLATDECKVRTSVTPEFLSVIRKHEDLEVEIQGKAVMVRLKKPVSVESATIISEVVIELTGLK